MNEKQWIATYGKHPRVVRWLKDNPPPKKWKGTPEQYAYCEMLLAPGWEKTK